MKGNDYLCAICGEPAIKYIHDGTKVGEALKWPDDKKRKACVCSNECASRLRKEMQDGKI